MAEDTVAAKKFLRLFDYMERIGLDVAEVAATVELKPDRIAVLSPGHALPATHYGRLYKAAALKIEALGHGLPWAAGLGGETFELMCHCMIGGRTLCAMHCNSQSAWTRFFIHGMVIACDCWSSPARIPRN